MTVRESARVRIVEAADRAIEAMRLEAVAVKAGDLAEAAKQADNARVDSVIAFCSARLAVFG